MKRWIAPLASLSAVAGVVALALFLAGVFDGDDAAGTGAGGPEAAALCAEDSPDCDDTLVARDGEGDDGGDTVAPGCEVGHVGVCDDTPIADGETGDLFEGDGPALQPACAPGFPDCVDMIVNGASSDDNDAEPPADPIVPAEGECSGDEFASCEEQAIHAALADAERFFGIDESAIVVESAAFQEWSNSCLGAAAEGEGCDEAITPGFVIVIDVEGTQYEYHTDLNGNARLAL